MNIEEFVSAIVAHDEMNRSHGINCACMDKFIRALRKATQVENPKAQRRVDYVFETAQRNRALHCMGEMKSNE